MVKPKIAPVGRFERGRGTLLFVASAKLTSLEDLVRAELRAPVAELVGPLVPEVVAEEIAGLNGNLNGAAPARHAAGAAV